MKTITIVIVAASLLIIGMALMLLTSCTLPGQGGRVEYLRTGEPAPFAGYLWSGPELETPIHGK